MTEQHYQKKIKDDFRALGCQVSKYHANVYSETGHSDLIIGIPPRKYFVGKDDYYILPICLYVEVKPPGGKLRVAQVLWHKRMQKEGHWTCVATYPEDVHEYLAGRNIYLKRG